MTRSAAMRLLATIAIIIMIVMTPATVCYSSSSTADPSRVKGNVVVDDIANGWIVHVASKHGANNNNPNNNSDSEATAYTVKCADGFSVNSDSAHVRQHEVHSVAMLLSMISSAATSTRWIPVDGFLNKNLPLCAKTCKFQSSLKNGLIQFGSSIKLANKVPSTQSSSTHYVELFQNSRIKYQCFDGYTLRSFIHPRRHRTSSSPSIDQTLVQVRYSRTYFIETCEPTKQQQQQRRVQSNQHNDDDDDDDDDDDENHRIELDEYDDDDESLRRLMEANDYQADGGDDDDDDTAISPSPSASANTMNTHECVKLCRALRAASFRTPNGLLVPQRDWYKPSERVSLMCKPGHVASLLNRTSNMLRFECARNGTWHLVTAAADSQQVKSRRRGSAVSLSAESVERVPACVRLKGVEAILREYENGNINHGDFFYDIRNSINNDLNNNNNNNNSASPSHATPGSNNGLNLDSMRRTSLVFVLGLLAIASLVVGIVKCRFDRAAAAAAAAEQATNAHHRTSSHHTSAFAHNHIHSSVSAAVEYPILTLFPAAAAAATGSLPSSASMNNMHLPTYEEAMRQRPASMSHHHHQQQQQQQQQPPPPQVSNANDLNKPN